MLAPPNIDELCVDGVEEVVEVLVLVAAGLLNLPENIKLHSKFNKEYCNISINIFICNSHCVFDKVREAYYIPKICLKI